MILQNLGHDCDQFSADGNFKSKAVFVNTAHRNNNHLDFGLIKVLCVHVFNEEETGFDFFLVPILG